MTFPSFPQQKHVVSSISRPSVLYLVFTFLKMKRFTIAFHKGKKVLFQTINSNLAKISIETRCPHGWHKLHGDNCYKVISSYASWFQAHEGCRLRGAHLASIHSKEESMAIWHSLGYMIDYRFYGMNVWIGGHRLRAANNWEWSDGTPWDFEHWNGQETNKKDSDMYCLKMMWDDAHSAWRQQPCYKIGRRLPYVCKIDSFKGEYGKELF